MDNLIRHMKERERKIFKATDKLVFDIAREAYDLGREEAIDEAWDLFQRWGAIKEDRPEYDETKQIPIWWDSYEEFKAIAWEAIKKWENRKRK